MTWELWPCDQCHQQGRDIAGIRNLGNQGHCSTHLTALYARFGPEAWVDGGVGLQTGPLHPEYGPLEADLTCCCCQAGWTGVPGDPCQWCQRERQIQIDYQIDLLLRWPDTNPDDTTYEARMRAWADRMAIGVKAGLITTRQAETAWARATKVAA
jgi:hypothetical protein